MEMTDRLLEKLHSYVTRKTAQNASAQIFCFQGLSFRIAERFAAYVHEGHILLHNGSNLDLFVLDSDHHHPENPKFIDVSASVLRRNGDAHHYLLLQPFGTISTLSTEETVELIGIENNAYSELDELCASELFKEIVSTAIPSGNDEAEYSLSLVQASVEELLKADTQSIDGIWDFLDGLLDITSNVFSLSTIEAYCGFPSSHGLRISDAMRMQKNFHRDLFEAVTDTVVAEEMIESLNIEAERDDSMFSLDDVKEFQKFINSELPLLDAMPLTAIARSFREERVYLSWWKVISLSEIYKAIKGSEDRTALDISAINAIAGECSNKKQPIVFTDKIEFKIKSKLPTEDDFQVRKGKSTNQPCSELLIPPFGNIDYIHELTEEEKTKTKDSSGRLKLFFSSKHTRKSYSYDVLSLSYIQSGMYFTIKDKENIYKVKPFKVKSRHASKTFRTEITLIAAGDITCELFVTNNARLIIAPIQYEDQNHEQQYFNFRSESSDRNYEHYSFRITAYNELTFQFKGAIGGKEYTYEIVFFIKQVNTSNESSFTWYDEHVRRNLLHVNSPLSQINFQEVLLPAGKDIYQFEQELLQVAAEGLGGYPVILGDDYRDVQRKGDRPDFSLPVSYTKLPFSTNMDTRLDFESWSASLNSFGNEYRNARFNLFSRFATDYPDKRIEEIDLSSLPSDYEELIRDYVNTYSKWLDSDYVNASISEQIWVYPTRENNTLDELPLEVIFPPYHPLRLAWLYRAQCIMAQSEKIQPSSAVSIFDSDTIPDMLYLPVSDIGGKRGSIRSIPMFSVKSSSRYWGILRDYSVRSRNISHYRQLWSDTFGLSFEQTAQTITKDQVESALDDAREMCIAKSSLSVSFSGASCDSICREGIVSWNKQFIDETNNAILRFGPRRLKIYDIGGNHLPSNEVIASIGDQSNGLIQWFAPEKNNEAVDLSISTLAARERTIRESPLGESVTVAGGLGCYRARQLRGGSYLIESRKTKAIIDWREKDNCIAVAISSILEKISQHSNLPIQEEKSHIGFPTDVRSLLSNEKSAYYAISSADVDHACFVAESGAGDAYLWDYRLPQNNTGSRNTDGFYLLARETPVMCKAVSQAIASISGTKKDISNDVVKKTLHVTAQRGIPTVKDLTLGGTKALGEVGILIAVTVLQDDITTALNKGLFPPLVDKDDNTWLNFVVPFDPFRSQFESLLQVSDKKVRPDLACISVCCTKNDTKIIPLSMKFSFIEVKARTNRFSDSDKQLALHQYSTCHDLLANAITCKEMSLHTLAVYDFLVGLVTFGFRVFSTFKGAEKLGLDSFYTDVIAAMFKEQHFIQIENEPRLIVVDTGDSAVMNIQHGVHCVLSLNGPSVCNNIAASKEIDLPNGLEPYWCLLALPPSLLSRIDSTDDSLKIDTQERTKVSETEVEGDRKDIEGQPNVPQSSTNKLQENEQSPIPISQETELAYQVSSSVTTDIKPSQSIEQPSNVLDKALEQEMESAKEEILNALAEAHIQATLVEPPKFSPNSLIFVFDGSPRSMSVSAIQSRITEFKVHYGVDIRSVIPLRKKVSIHVAREKRQTVIWEQVWPQISDECEKEKKLYIGIAEEDGKPLFLDPVKSHAPHTLVAGATKSGKSVLLRNLLLGIASIYKPHESRIILIDPKMGQDYYAFEKLPHLYDMTEEHCWISTQDKAKEILRILVEEMNKRTILLSQYHCENLLQYQEKVKPDSSDWMPFLWVFHDEFATWMLDKNYKQLVDSTISQLAVMARSVGIHLVFATQRPSAEVITPQTRSNLGNRLILKVADSNNSIIALGQAGAESLLGGGHILIKREGEDGDAPVEGQVAFHDKKDIEAQVQAIIKKYANVQLSEPLLSKKLEGHS